MCKALAILHAYTLCFVQREDGALLFLHRRHPPNLGRLNGLGGKVDLGEDLITSAQREVLEESGLAIEPRLGGVISLWWPEVTAAGRGPVFLFLFHAVVDAATDAAMPLSGSEGRLCRLDPTALAEHPVVTNIPVFLPPLLAQPLGAVFSGTFWYTAAWDAAEYILHLPSGPVRGHLAG